MGAQETGLWSYASACVCTCACAWVWAWSCGVFFVLMGMREHLLKCLCASREVLCACRRKETISAVPVGRHSPPRQVISRWCRQDVHVFLALVYSAWPNTRLNKSQLCARKAGSSRLYFLHTECFISGPLQLLAHSSWGVMWKKELLKGCVLVCKFEWGCAQAALRLN